MTDERRNSSVPAFDAVGGNSGITVTRPDYHTSVAVGHEHHAGRDVMAVESVSLGCDAS